VSARDVPRPESSAAQWAASPRVRRGLDAKSAYGLADRVEICSGSLRTASSSSGSFQERSIGIGVDHDLLLSSRLCNRSQQVRRNHEYASALSL